jgi:hypothetical protein
MPPLAPKEAGCQLRLVGVEATAKQIETSASFSPWRIPTGR